jgi:4-amino-4-deoxy-L-arabinose transferase-like glycosyltransferase
MPEWMSPSRRMKLALLFAIFLIAFLLRIYHPISRPLQWYVRAGAFNEAIAEQKWKQTYQSRHPGVMGMVIGGIGLNVYHAAQGTPLEAIYDWAAPTSSTERGREITAGIMALAFVISACIAINTYLLSKLANWQTAAVAGGLMALSPFYLTHSRVFHLDALAASFMIVSGLLILLYGQTRRRRYLLLSGLVAGIALITKVPSLFMLPFAGLVLMTYLVVHIVQSYQPYRHELLRWVIAETWRLLILPLLMWIGMAIIPILLWPAMWVQPISVLNNIFVGTSEHVSEGHPVTRFFDGKLYREEHPTALFYPVTILYNATFVVIPLTLVALGHYTLWRKRLHLPVSPVTFWLMVAYVVFFIIEMGIGAKQVDRYVMPAHVMIDVIAAIGAAGLINLIAQTVSGWRRMLQIAAVSLAIVLPIALQAIASLPFAPNYGAHHNFLMGGNPRAVEMLEIMGQNEGIEYVGAYLREHAESDAKIGVSWPLDESLADFYPGQVKKTTLEPADYFVFDIAAVQRQYDVADWKDNFILYQETRTPQLIIRFNGVDYIWLYANNPEAMHETIIIEHAPIWLNPIGWVWVGVLTLTLLWVLRISQTLASLIPPGAWKPRRLAGWEWSIIAAILLLAAILRFAQFSHVPPGISHDEVFDWYNAQLIYKGDIRALYPYGGGREPLYQFLVALTFKLIGSNIMALRLPAIALGMIGIAGTYALARRLFGRFAAVFASTGLATSYWALTMSRLGERTGSAPVMGILVVYVYLRLLQERKPPLWQYALAGAALSLSLHTYPAALMMPIIIAAWLGVTTVVHREWLVGKWRGLALSFGVAALLSLPLALAWTNPANITRADTVNGPLEALLGGDPSLVLANIPLVLGMFTIQGDPGLDVNNNALPVYSTALVQALFYFGLLWALIGLFSARDKRRAGYALALIWLIAMLVPTLVTQRALNPSRTVGLLGIVFIVPAIAVMGIHEFFKHNNQRQYSYGLMGAVGLALILQLQNTAYNYYVSWPANPVVRFWYQDYYVDIAKDLDARSDQPPAAIAGLTPEMMDPGSMILLMNNDAYAQSLEFFNPQNALLLPAGNSDETTLIAVPATVPLHPVLAGKLGEWGVTPEMSNEVYTMYVARPETLTASGSEHLSLEYAFHGAASRADYFATLLGTEIVGEAAPGQSFTLLTYWIIDQQPANLHPLRIFVHMITPDGIIVAQSDILGVPAVQWRQGDVIVQTHDIALLPDAPPGPYKLRIGLYNPETNIRLQVDDVSGDFVEIDFAQ